jgi:hypothetical protein
MMIQKLAAYNQTFFDPNRTGSDPQLAAHVAANKYKGFWGPFLA